MSISKDSLNWIVFSINDDGTVDLISDISTNQNIYFKGATGYNNGVYLLNDIADEFYSNDSLEVTARSLTIEDIEAGMNETGIEYVRSYSNVGTTVGDTKTYTSSSYRYYPNLYAQENGSGIDLKTINDPNSVIKKDGINQSNNYYSEPTTETFTHASKSLTVKKTYYYRSMSSSHYKNSKFYDFASCSLSKCQHQTRHWHRSRSRSCLPNYSIVYCPPTTTISCQLVRAECQEKTDKY